MGSCRTRVGAVLFASTALTMMLIASEPGASASDPPRVTLIASSSNKPLTGYVYVDFEQAGHDQAKLHGAVTGAPAGSSVELFSSSFPFKTTSKGLAIARLILSAGRASYSFTAIPQLATRYFVMLRSGGSSPKVLARSATSTVYATAGGRFDGTYTTCGRPICHESLSTTAFFPRSVAPRESTKRWYVYLGLSLAPSVEPPPPKIEYLHANWHASSIKIGPTAYKQTVHLSFTIGSSAYRWDWDSLRPRHRIF